MGHEVNPPPQLRIPDVFFKDKVTRSFFERLIKIVWQIWLRTGGPEDLIDSSEQALTSTSSRVARNAARIHSLEKIEFDVVAVTADYTAGRNQILVCKNTSSIDVTLDPNAIEGDQVHIKRRDAAITVIGTIDGLTNKLINIKNYSMYLVFDGIDWSEI